MAETREAKPLILWELVGARPEAGEMLVLVGVTAARK